MLISFSWFHSNHAITIHTKRSDNVHKYSQAIKKCLAASKSQGEKWCEIQGGGQMLMAMLMVMAVLMAIMTI